MFTGIIKAIGRIVKTQRKAGSLFLTIQKPKGWKLKPGDSVAADGVCLTVKQVNQNNYTTELMPETLRKTYFGKTTPKELNLEQSLRLSDRLGGHLVLGHVDAVGTLEKIKNITSSKIFRISFPSKFRKLVALKGSIAVDGVSLTLIDVWKDRFTVSLVDYTLKHTTLGEKEVKDFVNLEFDIIAKYLNYYASGRKS